MATTGSRDYPGLPQIRPDVAEPADLRYKQLPAHRSFLMQHMIAVHQHWPYVFCSGRSSAMRITGHDGRKADDVHRPMTPPYCIIHELHSHSICQAPRYSSAVRTIQTPHARNAPAKGGSGNTDPEGHWLLIDFGWINWWSSRQNKRSRIWHFKEISFFEVFTGRPNWQFQPPAGFSSAGRVPVIFCKYHPGHRAFENADSFLAFRSRW